MQKGRYCTTSFLWILQLQFCIPQRPQLPREFKLEWEVRMWKPFRTSPRLTRKSIQHLLMTMEHCFLIWGLFRSRAEKWLGTSPHTFTAQSTGRVGFQRRSISKSWGNYFRMGSDRLAFFSNIFWLEFKIIEFFYNSAWMNPSFIGESESKTNKKYQWILFILPFCCILSFPWVALAIP